MLNLAELTTVNPDMKRCLFDLERCRRSIAGLLFILPNEGLDPDTTLMFDSLQPSLAKQFILQPTFFAFETPQIK